MLEKPHDHIYMDRSFNQWLVEAAQYFYGTPLRTWDNIERMQGAGVYSLYIHDTEHPIYGILAKQHIAHKAHPIYVGKAVPKGWRQGKTEPNHSALWERLMEHRRSLQQASNIEDHHVHVRYMVLPEESSAMIGTLESFLIHDSKPLWNIHLDGFGNHDPGKGRYLQQASLWDTVHPGRPWSLRCVERAGQQSALIDTIRHHLERKFNVSPTHIQGIQASPDFASGNT
jgi:hypothetical protein